MRGFSTGCLWLMLAACQGGVGATNDDSVGSRPEDDELEVIDSDRDGLSDGDEAALGSDPAIPTATAAAASTVARSLPA